MALPMPVPLAVLDHTIDHREAIHDPSIRRVAARFRDFLEALGLDLTDPNLSGTEWRVARAFREIFAGFYAGAEPALRTFPNTEGYSEMVAVTDIPFRSLCAHHFLPFSGTAHVAYVPHERLKAYFAVNGDAADLPLLQQLIRNRTALGGREGQLQDPAFALKSLL